VSSAESAEAISFDPPADPICHNCQMCGRYRLSRRKHLVEEYFAASGEEDWSPRYNIAPTQPVSVIRQHPKEPSRVLSLMRWGLIPSWAKDMSGAAGMINARSETAATKPAFRDPMKFCRCSCSGGRVLRMEANGRDKAALLLRGQRRRVVRICWALGSLAGSERAMDQVVLDPDHDTKRRDIVSSRPYASDSSER
jgi:hypothetical protein